MNRQFIFKRSASDSAVVPVDSFSHAEYGSDTTVKLYFDAKRSGKDATIEVILTVASGKAHEVLSLITSHVSSSSASSMKYDAVANSYHAKNVTGITSITITEDPSVTTGPTGATGATGPQGAAGADGADGADGSDATGLGGTDQTLTADRVIDVSGNTLNFKDGATVLGRYDNLADEWLFNKNVNVQGDFRVTATSGVSSSQIKLNEPALGGSNGVVLKAPSTNLTSDVTFVLPDADGSANQVLKTDGSGNFGFSDHASKTYGSITCGFFDDFGTQTHYLPLNAPPTEQTSDNNSYADWLCPCNIVVKSVQLRISNLSGAGNITVTVEKDPVGSAIDTDVESETVAVTAADDQDVIHFLFDNAAVSVGEKLKVKIQADADVTGTSNNFAVVVYEADWSTRYTQASAVISS